MNALTKCLPLMIVSLLTFVPLSPALALENEAIVGTIVTASEGQVAFVDAIGAQRILTTTPDCEVIIDGRRAAIDNLQSGMAAMLLVNRNSQCMQIVASTEVGRRGLW